MSQDMSLDEFGRMTGNILETKNDQINYKYLYEKARGAYNELRYDMSGMSVHQRNQNVNITRNCQSRMFSGEAIDERKRLELSILNGEDWDWLCMQSDEAKGLPDWDV